MSELLGLFQVLIGLATLVVAILPLRKENPPPNGEGPNQDED